MNVQERPGVSRSFQSAQERQGALRNVQERPGLFRTVQERLVAYGMTCGERQYKAFPCGLTCGDHVSENVT